MKVIKPRALSVMVRPLRLDDRAYLCVSVMTLFHVDQPGWMGHEAALWQHVAELLHEGLEVAEVVAVIGVAHDDEDAARRRDPALERGAVATLLDVDAPRAVRPRDFLRAIGASVVRDDDLAVDTRFFHRCLRLPDADFKRLRFIQTRHDDTQLDFRVRGC